MTYKQAAQSALDVQDASNLSGVVFSFAKVMQAVCDESHRIGKGTAWRNSNPIVTMYLLKLGELNGCDSTLSTFYEVAERECQKIVAEE